VEEEGGRQGSEDVRRGGKELRGRKKVDVSLLRLWNFRTPKKGGGTTEQEKSLDKQ
jgi:hypothetical protein